MSLDKNLTERENLNALNMLGDIGGVQSILFSMFQFILFFVNYNNFDTFMASKLYKIKNAVTEDEEQKEQSYFARSSFFKPSKYDNLLQYLSNSFPSCLICCKETRNDKGIKKAVASMDGEIDILEIVKSLRFTKMAIGKLLSHKDRMDIKERTRYIMIDPDSDEVESKL